VQRPVRRLRKVGIGAAPIQIDLDSVTEARLVAQALAGSEAAYEQIVRRHQRAVLTLLVRITGDAALAEDLAQDAFVKAFRNLHTFDPARRLSSWLLRIAHNTAIDALRRQRLRTVPIDTAAADDQPLDPAAPELPDPLERRALADALQSAMHRLSPDQRTAVSLRYDEGLSFAEIGHVLGMPEPTARSHVHRARKTLAAALSALGYPHATSGGNPA
jgi:RNA polymerase sigma-70 factor (ECF subfamily)